MKFAYFTYDEEKEFEVQVDILESIDDKYVVDEVLPMDEDDIEMFDNISEELLVLQPYNDGEDFYLRYINHSDYYKIHDENFKIGSLISHTLARNDEKDALMTMLRNVYHKGIKKEGILKFLSDEGKLLKYHTYRYFKRGDTVIGVTTDRTEVKMYRDSTLNDKKLGVAIIQNNRIVEVNENYAKFIHRTREDLLNNAHEFKGMSPEVVNMVKSELKAIETQQKLSYKSPVVKYDEKGNLLFYLNAEATYITYNNMPAVLVKVLDLTEQERYKQFVERNSDEDKRLQKSWDDLVENSITFNCYGVYPDDFHVSENFYDVIEDEHRNFFFNRDTIRNFIFNEDLRYFDAKLASITPSNTEVEFITRIMTLNFNIKYLRHHIEKIFDSEGNAQLLISSHQDVTKETVRRNDLQKEIYMKNEIIKNKDVEIKEAHHNIKNNLNILLSLIRLEEHFNKDSAKILEDTKSNINAISLIHEKLYQSKTLVDIELKEYVDSIVESLLSVYSSAGIKYESHVEDISLNAKQAGTLGIMINEFIHNTVKYAFPDGDPGIIEIRIGRVDKKIEMEYRDSGVGLPDNVDFYNPVTLGFLVIQNLTKQLNGKIKYDYDDGFHINMEFIEADVF